MRKPTLRMHFEAQNRIPGGGGGEGFNYSRGLYFYGDIDSPSHISSVLHVRAQARTLMRWLCNHIKSNVIF